MDKPPHGFVVGGKWYSECPACEKTIRVDKPLIGSLHVCLTPDEIQEKQERGEL